jgi:hypothetical protein
MASCATPNEYRTPPQLTAQTAATIIGTKQENPDLLAGDLRVYHVAIDKQLTLAGTQGWDKPVLVSGGEHLITFGIAYGRKRIGFTEARINFEPGKTYVLQARRHGDWSAVGWIEERNGRPVSEEAVVSLSEGRPLFTPVFIPVK